MIFPESKGTGTTLSEEARVGQKRFRQQLLAAASMVTKGENSVRYTVYWNLVAQKLGSE